MDEKFQKQAQESSAAKGKGWDLAGEVVSGTVAAVPDAVIAVMTAGASTGAQAGKLAASQGTKTAGALNTVKNVASDMAKNPMYWSSVMRTVGTDYEEAKEKGANDFVAGTTAVITSLLNAGIEVGGGIEQLPAQVKTAGKMLCEHGRSLCLMRGKKKSYRELSAVQLPIIHMTVGTR